MNPAQKSDRSFQETSLHLLAAALSALTLCLLFVGAMVTSTNSGLAVPDWPTTFGKNMFTYPVSGMKGGIFYEHGHRLFATAVGSLTVFLNLAVWSWEPRKWLRGLAVAALGLVIVQGLLGGITVRFKLPIAVSSAHGGLAEVFFCCTAWLTWATSGAWKQSPAWRKNFYSSSAFILMAAVFLQVLVGAVMRHSFSSFAIPTFPRAFGAWIPPFWNRGIALNFLHTRLGPVLVAGGGLWLAVRLMRLSAWPGSGRLGMTLLGALGVQIGLGILTLWTGKIPWVASLHLAGGAFLLGVLFSIGLWSGKREVRPA